MYCWSTASFLFSGVQQSDSGITTYLFQTLISLELGNQLPLSLHISVAVWVEYGLNMLWVHLSHFSRFHTYALIYDSFLVLTSASVATPEDRCVDTMKGQWWKGRVGRIGRLGLTHIHCHELNSWWEAAVGHRELSSVVCDDLEGWDVGREA